MLLPAISQECTLGKKTYMHDSYGDWAVPVRLAYMTPTSKNTHRPKNTCQQFYEFSGILPGGYKGNASTDLRHRCGSSRHIFETQALLSQYPRMHKAPRRCQEAKKPPFPTNSAPGTEKTLAHVGKQHATPVRKKEQEATCWLTQENVT